MNVSNTIKMNYKNFIPLAGYKNKPNQTQFKPKTKPISKRPKMNLNNYYTNEYENKIHCTLSDNKPNQTQFKPNSNPVKANFRQDILKILILQLEACIIM